MVRRVYNRGVVIMDAVDGGPLIQPSTSAFGEQQVVAPLALLDYYSKYGLDTRIWDTNTVGGGTITEDPDKSAVDLNTTTASGDIARIRTNTYLRYQAGRGQSITLTVFMSAPEANNIREWCLGDDDDGVGFRLNGTELDIFIKTSTSGAPTERVWRLGYTDPPAGDIVGGWDAEFEDLDSLYGNLYDIQFQWLGVGVVAIALNGIRVLTVDNPNTLEGPYMKTATLPISITNENTGAVAGATRLSMICAKVASQGGNEPPTFTYSASNAIAGVSVSTTEVPLVAVRMKQNFTTLLDGISVSNRSIVLPKVMTVNRVTTGNIVVKLRFFDSRDIDASSHGVAGGAWASVSPDSFVESNLTGTSVTGGEVLFQDVLNAEDTTRPIDLGPFFHRLDRHLRRAAFTPFTSDEIAITAEKTSGGSTTMRASLMWGEIR